MNISNSSVGERTMEKIEVARCLKEDWERRITLEERSPGVNLRIKNDDQFLRSKELRNLMENFYVYFTKDYGRAYLRILSG